MEKKLYLSPELELLKGLIVKECVLCTSGLSSVGTEGFKEDELFGDLK